MYALGDCRLETYVDNTIIGRWIYPPALGWDHPDYPDKLNSAALRTEYNMLFVDAHVESVKATVLFNKTNAACLSRWNNDQSAGM